MPHVHRSQSSADRGKSRTVGAVSSRVRMGLFAASLTPFAVLWAAPSPQPLPAPGPGAKMTYRGDIEPLFKAHCSSCHTGASSSGGLDLSTPKGIMKGGVSGKMIEAGDPQRSVLLQRVRGLGGKPQMPMGFPALSPAEIKKIETWIAEGASFAAGGGKTHWAYVAPVKPKVPALASAWVANPIDAFVLQRLQKESLKPSPAAAREALLRRVTLDLTGLPPTLAEMDAFLADKSPNAYEKVVDRLLSSPHYGERQARGWLDLARYADSDGYEKDLNRTAWPYRDWVIKAFNRNMPFDQFTIRQIAGDLLERRTTDDLVATGFHRNTMFNREGGVDQEEAHFAVVLDRVDTTATVWLGSTMGCARCHDHKYDPFTQRDYYKMAAFYNHTVVIPKGPKDVGEEKWFEPEIPVPTDAQRQESDRLTQQIAALEAELKRPNPDAQAAYQLWKTHAAERATWETVRPTVVGGKEGVLNVEPDGTVVVTGVNPAQNSYGVTLPTTESRITGLCLEAVADANGKGPGRADNGNFVMTGFRVTVDGKPVAYLPEADFIQATYALDGLSLNDKESGWAIVPQTGKTHRLIVTFPTPLPPSARLSITMDFQSPWEKHTLGRFRLMATSDANPAGELLPASLRNALTAGSTKSSDEQALRDYYAAHSLSSASTGRLITLRQRLKALQKMFPTALVMQEKPGKDLLTEYVRHRGEFMTKTEKVTAGTPAILPALPPGRATRLELAKWLVSPKNPLTARVVVNRMWEQYFGRGLVETSEDFGTRGSRPTHPELLDWLATTLVESGWNMKAMHRLIVMSSTYRQTSNATPGLLAKDPQNLLLARGPRFRMDAEAIRDTALAAGGLLSDRIGGPSVFPYQPDGIWDSPYSGEQWMLSQGPDRYRRSIYTFWKRTAPYPAFISFDATSRESCTVRRIRTNTPLQALTLLNDQEMLEAAAGLARRMRQSGKTPEERLSLGFRVCTGRRPKPTELTRLRRLLTKLESRYATNPKAASAWKGDADTAAWSMVASVMLNLDETISKG